MHTFSTDFLYSFNRYTALAMAGAALVLTTGTASACSVCGCSLSSDWAAQGYNVMPGTEFNLRYEYYDQDQLRGGTSAIDRSTLTFPNADEIQQETITRSVWLGADYVPARDWGISLQIPYYNRFHSTIAPGDVSVSSARASGLGDARVLARYQNPSLTGSWSFQFGLKLPTGRIDQDFVTGPQAGTLLDRGLQLGTGTTDALLGASYFGRLGNTLGYFAQAMLQHPFEQRSGFLPASSLNFNVGIRWLNTSRFTPQLQLNTRWDGREKGPEADYENSGDTLMDLSPGVTAEITRKIGAFAFVQVPLYERVNGLQLEPRWLISIGFSYAL